MRGHRASQAPSAAARGVDDRGSRGGAEQVERGLLADRLPAVRLGVKASGERSLASQGPGLRASGHPHTGWQGRQGSRRDATRRAGDPSQAASRQPQDPVRTRLCGGLWHSVPPVCFGPQVSERGIGVGLAVCVRGRQGERRSAVGRTAAASRGRKRRAEGGPRRVAPVRDPQAGELPYLAPHLLRPTCSSVARTYALSRNSSVTRTCERHRSTRTFSSAAGWRCRVRLEPCWR